ncbi:F-box domain-containing protein [Colletotrichum phormii]|uniref:F-box domain-containing protein n=1 Tax=Colletotrichum phormii TaxID=359342 RepID=A0AAI9ZQI9_9PEZI|nr:F-box domain-containing protein [Colletotrichum phormii]KAK1634979.1 F-box domain-containing protein [Colletotrichum phormii]
MDAVRARKRPTPAPAAERSPRSADKEASDRTQLAGFTDLPAEIHLLISKQLIYPDALSLKHTSSYFYYLVDTGVRLKVEWLMERRMLHLECPNDKRCDLGSDLRFCRGSVPLLMQRRREHMECESRPGLGCLVYGTSVCSHRRKIGARCQRWLRRRLTVELWWVLIALIPIACCWLWMAEFATWASSAYRTSTSSLTDSMVR